MTAMKGHELMIRSGAYVIEQRYGGIGWIVSMSLDWDDKPLRVRRREFRRSDEASAYVEELLRYAQASPLGQAP